LYFRQPLPAAGLELRLLQLCRRPVPLRRGTPTKTVQIRSARGGIQSNRRKKTPTPTRIKDHPTPTCEHPPLPSSSSRRARRPPMRAMRHHCIPSRGGAGALQTAGPAGLVDVRCRRRRRRRNPKKRCGEGREEADG
jgi:hypothetical protein